jgi:hypothetical protein
MVPDYILERAESPGSPIRSAFEATKGARFAFFHRSKSNEKLLDGAEAVCDDLGLKVVN